MLSSWKRMLVGAVGATLLAGCAGRAVVNQPNDVVLLEMGAHDFKIAGTGKGKDCKRVILGIQSENPSLAKAETQALEQSGGRFLINKRLYSGDENDYLVVKDRCRYVEGTGVTF